MGIDGRFNVRHAAVAYLDTVFVEDLVELVLTWEVFLYQVQKVSPYVRRGVVVERWIEPGDISLPALLLLVYCGGFVLKSVIVSGSLESCFVIRCCLLEDLLICRYITLL